MFLSKSEPLCVPSTTFPGLCSNYIHILDVDEIGGADVAVIPFSIASENGSYYTPYYIPPQDIDNLLCNVLSGDISAILSEIDYV